jgi:hypothetical protein
MSRDLTAKHTRRRAFVAVGPCLWAAAFLLAFYVVLYPVKGIRVPLGSDTPVYVWWARYAGAVGLETFGGGRPATVALLAALARISGEPITAVAGALPPALAASLGLAAAALTEASLGPDRTRFVLVAVLTGAFLSLMVPGYLSTLAFGALFVCGLACVAEDLRSGRRRWAPVVAAAVLIGAAGLAHALFLVLAGLVVAGAAVALLPSWRRQGAEGDPVRRRSLSRLAMASGGGVALTAAGLLAGQGPGGHLVDTSRDSVLRRAGLDPLVRQSYRRKLRHDFPWYRTATLVGLALTPLAGGGAALPGPGSDQRRLFVGALAAWLAATVGGVVALLAGTAAPGQRLAAFCIPLPVLAAVGLVAARRRRGAVASAGVVLFLTVAWLAWGGQYPLASTEQVLQAREAGALIATEPPGTPLVLVMDARGDKPALFVTRALNYLRGAVPPDRVPDVYAFVGTPADLQAGRPTLTGDVEHDRLALDYWRQVRPLLARNALAVVLSAYDRASFGRVASPTNARGGVAVVLGSRPRCPGSACAELQRIGESPDSAPLSPWSPVWLSPLLLALIGSVGWVWSRAALPDASPRIQVAVAPALGAAAIGLAAVAVDSAGIRLSGAGAGTALGLAALGGLIAGPVIELRRQRAGAGGRAGPAPPPPDPGPR